MGDIADPEAGDEAQLLVEAVNPRISTPALHQHVMTVVRPGARERGPSHGTAVPAPTSLRMRDNILQKAVPPSATQKIRYRDEHARRSDFLLFVGYEDVHARLRQSLLPNALGALERLGRGTHLGRRE